MHSLNHEISRHEKWTTGVIVVWSHRKFSRSAAELQVVAEQIPLQVPNNGCYFWGWVKLTGEELKDRRGVLRKLLHSARGSVDQEGAQEAKLYEDVSRLSPYGRRVLLLLGAAGVGRRTLKARLLQHDRLNFATVTPCM